ncbi:MAG: replicative DNA helicase, partial [Brasilonema sp.]
MTNDERMEAQGFEYWFALAIQTERELLGQILLAPSVFEMVVDKVKPEYFVSEQHRQVYRAMFTVYQEDNKLPDLISMRHKLVSIDALPELGGHMSLMRFLVGLMDSVVSAVTADINAEYVQKYYQDRKIREIPGTLAQIAEDHTISPEDKLRQFDEVIASVRVEAQEEDNRTQSLQEIGINYFSYLESLNEGEENIASIPTGFYDLDIMLAGGFGRGDLIVIAGRPSMGKSALLQSTLYKIAKARGENVFLFSLEMNKRQVASRILSAITEISSDRLKFGGYSEYEWTKILQAMDDFTTAPMCICDKFTSGWSAIASEFKRRRMQYGDFCILAVDYLQLMVDGTDPRLVYIIGEITRRAKLLAQEYNIPVILLSQLSRGVE